MRIFRGPHSNDDFDPTDAKPLKDLPDDWTPGHITWLDGTKDKSGTRHTAIGVQHTPDDIASLSAALFRYHTERITELQTKTKESRETITQLEHALSQISKMIADHSDPSAELLLKNLKTIADHYRRSWTRKNPLELEGEPNEA